MPPRHLTFLLIAAIGSLLCYQSFRRTRDAVVVADALNLIHQQYLDPVDDRDLLIAAMKGMTDGLDPYSQFVPLDEYQQLQTSMSGEFAGIGIYVERPDPDGPVTIITPIVGSPALRAGLMAGDQFLLVDGVDVSAMDLPEVSARLKGPIGTTVDVVVARGEDRVEMTVGRDNILMESVVGWQRREDQSWSFELPDHPSLAYARLTTFGAKTPGELRAVMKSLQPRHRGLILDVRGNGGGLLDTAR